MKDENLKSIDVEESSPPSTEGFRIRNPEYYRVFSDGTTIFKLKNLIRVFSIVILFVVLLLLIIYGATVIADYEQSFPVKLGDEEKRISLCESSDMSLPTTHLKMPVTEKLADLSVSSIPDSIDSDEGGSHNGSGYLAYTFFLRNNNKSDEIQLTEQIDIVSSSKRADEAIRIRVYRNGVPTTYAAYAANGVPEYGTTPFVSKDKAVEETQTLAGGEIIRYTIVVWLEGDDPECENNISGGSIRLGFSFTTD